MRAIPEPPLPRVSAAAADPPDEALNDSAIPNQDESPGGGGFLGNIVKTLSVYTSPKQAAADASQAVGQAVGQAAREAKVAAEDKQIP